MIKISIGIKAKPGGNLLSSLLSLGIRDKFSRINTDKSIGWYGLSSKDSLRRVV